MQWHRILFAQWWSGRKLDYGSHITELGCYGKGKADDQDGHAAKAYKRHVPCVRRECGFCSNQSFRQEIDDWQRMRGPDGGSRMAEEAWHKRGRILTKRPD